jgi:hypothetical protein
VPSPRRTVTRREYAEVVVRLGAAELQLQRTRAALETQAQRIAQLEEQVTALTSATAAQALATLPVPATTPTVES